MEGADGTALITVLVAVLMLPFLSICFLLLQRRRSEEATDEDENDVAKSASSTEDIMYSKAGNETPSAMERRIMSKPDAEVDEDDTDDDGANPPFFDTNASLEVIAETNNKNNNKRNNWKCACEGGFLPPSMFGNMEAVIRMGGGQCYHPKQKS